VSSLYALLMGHNSDFMASFYAAEEMIGMAVGPWKPGGAAGAGCLRSRTAQYTKKLNIPFAPKQCQVGSRAIALRSDTVHTIRHLAYFVWQHMRDRMLAAAVPSWGSRSSSWELCSHAPYG
jgi:hypothetical protein